jgi:hypothetical protein
VRLEGLAHLVDLQAGREDPDQPGADCLRDISVG